MTDIVFLLDTSDSITDAIFKEELEVVTKFIKSHTIGPQDVLVAVAMYAESTTEVFSVGAHKTRADLLQAVGILQRGSQKGSTNTAAALKLAKNKLLQTSNGARLASHKVIIVITDGANDDLFEMNKVATSLRKNGVNIIAFGVGMADISELKKITGKSSNVLVRPKGMDKDIIGDKIYKGKCGPVDP